MKFFTARRLVLICSAILLVGFAATTASSIPTAARGTAIPAAKTTTLRKGHLRPKVPFASGQVLVRFAPGTQGSVC